VSLMIVGFASCMAAMPPAVPDVPDVHKPPGRHTAVSRSAGGVNAAPRCTCIARRAAASARARRAPRRAATAAVHANTPRTARRSRAAADAGWQPRALWVGFFACARASCTNAARGGAAVACCCVSTCASPFRPRAALCTRCSRGVCYTRAECYKRERGDVSGLQRERDVQNHALRSTLPDARLTTPAAAARVCMRGARHVAHYGCACGATARVLT
jgi:hypothetical protein